MILENYIEKLQEQDKITIIRKEISKNLEIAGVLNSLEPRPVLFESVKESEFRVVGNLFCNKKQVADRTDNPAIDKSNRKQESS